MVFPDYFSIIPPITLHDPLAELLGAPADGLIEYRFADAVKLAGHCCPTVAGAWLMTTRALQALYVEAMPVRGQIRVSLGEAEDAGVAGVIASVATLLTGAAGPAGFKGLGGRHGRRHLLRFGVDGVAGLRLARLDTHAAVECTLRLQHVPGDPRLGELLAEILQGAASPAVHRLFADLWQDRVRCLLLDHGNDPEVVDVRPVRDQ